MATQPQEVTTAGGSRQRVVVLLLAVVLLVVLAVAVARPLLFPRSEVTAPAAPPATTTPSSSTSAPTTTGSGQPVGSSKDPFHPLVVAGGAATDAATAGSTPSQSSVPGSGSGSAAVPGGGSTAERKVTLDDVRGDSVKVSVDGTSYSVKEGESFAGDYRVVDIGSACATFESGTTPFTLCEGEAVLK
jgi:hypothetical protein